jgi:hypothetical protein
VESERRSRASPPGFLSCGRLRGWRGVRHEIPRAWRQPEVLRSCRSCRYLVAAQGAGRCWASTCLADRAWVHLSVPVARRPPWGVPQACEQGKIAPHMPSGSALRGVRLDLGAVSRASQGRTAGPPRKPRSGGYEIGHFWLLRGEPNGSVTENFGVPCAASDRGCRDDFFIQSPDLGLHSAPVRRGYDHR